MATKIYGASDDLIEFEGDVRGEANCYGTDGRDSGLLIVCSDATILEAKYGKNDAGIWELRAKHRGTLFDRIELCDNEDADPHSDVVHFQPGLKWAYVCDEWERVK